MGSNIFSCHWKGAWHDGVEQVRVELKTAWTDIFEEDDEGEPVMWWDRVLMVCEYPFVVMRKMTVPIPCEGHYNRGLVSASLLLSPLWLGYYLWNEHDLQLFWSGGIPWVLLFAGIGASVAAAVLRYAPAGEGNMALVFATPIALYGFLVAATWIDFIADHLVEILEFVGIVCRIPSSIMGLTILAWGNSMGDLSADVTMARKGLANMAMTACFAGPVFNILIGLGLGFSALSAQTGESSIHVHMNPAILVGFLATILNTLLLVIMGAWVFGGRIPRVYGYVLLFLYMCYVVLSVLLQFWSL